MSKTTWHEIDKEIKKTLNDDPDLALNVMNMQDTAKEIVNGHLMNMITAAEIAESSVPLVATELMTKSLAILAYACYVSKQPKDYAEHHLNELSQALIKWALNERYKDGKAK